MDDNPREAMRCVAVGLIVLLMWFALLILYFQTNFPSLLYGIILVIAFMMAIVLLGYVIWPVDKMMSIIQLTVIIDLAAVLYVIIITMSDILWSNFAPTVAIIFIYFFRDLILIPFKMLLYKTKKGPHRASIVMMMDIYAGCVTIIMVFTSAFFTTKVDYSSIDDIVMKAFLALTVVILIVAYSAAEISKELMNYYIKEYGEKNAPEKPLAVPNTQP